MKISGLPACLVVSLLLAAPCSAVRRPKYETAKPDTLRLSQVDFKKFETGRKAGSDLANLGLGLTVASVFSPYLLIPVLEGSRFEGESITLFALGIFPSALAVMAGGNHLYGRSAGMDTNNTYQVSNPIPPYTVYAATLINYAILWKYLDCDDSEDRGACTSGLWYGIPFLAEIALVPIMRMQFNRAKEILDNVEVVVAPGVSKFSLKLDF